MKEHEETPARYFHADQAIGEIQLWGETFTLRQRLHQSVERYSRRDTLPPFTEHSGNRLYFDSSPYIQIPSAYGHLGHAKRKIVRPHAVHPPQAQATPARRGRVMW
jgi:hypothetical protein